MAYDSIPSTSHRHAIRAAFRGLAVAGVGAAVAFGASALKWMWVANIGGVITLIGIMMVFGVVIGRTFTGLGKLHTPTFWRSPR